MEKTIETQVLIIGGGATGTGIARDLSLRGIESVLIEKSDLNSGASGGNHGLLHSGARYICSDPEAAVECNTEINILKKMAAHCIEETGGFFVGVQGDDENYMADFPSMCAKSQIPFKKISPKEARESEPELSDKTITVFQVNDATINPFRLSIENMNDAVSKGSRYLSYCKIIAFEMKKNAIVRAKIKNQVSKDIFYIQAQTYINASGAWAGQVAQKAGIDIPMVFSKGTLLVTSKRITHKVINRLRKATDGDILVPGGVVSILGTTSVRVDSPDHIYPTIDEVDHIITQGGQVVPFLKKCRYVRAYCGVRPLVSAGAENDRDVSRGFTLIDHEKDDVHNLVTITGGKLSTYRLMAQKTCDIVCDKLYADAACSTARVPLPSTSSGEWSEPGLFVSNPMGIGTHKDPLLCECEMVPASAVDEIVQAIRQNRGRSDLISISLRSRVGKGPCQGTFCSMRVLAYLYHTGQVDNPDSVNDLKRFLNKRWKGEHSLLWDQALVQSSVKEMIHCGVFGLELEESL